LLKIKIKTKRKPLPLNFPHLAGPTFNKNQPHPCYSLILTQLKKKNKEKENKKLISLPLTLGLASFKGKNPLCFFKSPSTIHSRVSLASSSKNPKLGKDF
jgi:hypothetical protein